MQPDELAPFALFRGSSRDELRRIGSDAHRRTVKRRERVFEAGDDATALFGVCEGYLKVSALTEAGAEITMGLFCPGDLFGAPAMLADGPRVASVTALSRCELFTIDALRFESLLASCPGLARRLLTLLAERTRHLVHHHIAIASLPVAQRLARKLLVLVRDVGEATPQGLRVVPSLSQQDLADMTATTRQSVNQTLRRWASEGHVAMGTGGIVVTDHAGLEAIAML